MFAARATKVIVSATMTIACSQPVLPTSPTSVPLTGAVNQGGLGAGREISLKGTLEGTFTFAPDPPPSTFASVHLDVSGHASHLGRFTLESPHRVDLGTLTALGSGPFTITAANGEKLTGQGTGSGLPTATPDVFAISETVIITGGTGRFAGATGSVSMERLVNLATSVTTGSITGTIFVP